MRATATAPRKTCARLHAELCIKLTGDMVLAQIIKLIQATKAKAAAAAKEAAEAKAAEAKAAAEARAAAERAALQSELEQLSLKEVRLRAAAEGVDQDAIEDARDGDTPKESLIELILAKKKAAGPAQP